MSHLTSHPPTISIANLLKKLHKPEVYGRADAKEIAASFALIFEENQLSHIQTATFLTLLTTTLRDRDADVIAACAAQMRHAALPIDTRRLQATIRPCHEGTYHGGLCDIVGTGGSIHQTYNISTTASLIASSLLLMSKHGNRAQTSVSGAADILSSIMPKPPNLAAATAENIVQIYEKSTYAFLFAPNFHPGMRLAAPVRREMGIRTIFNLLGPLAHPIEELVEARVVGVADGTLGPVFAEALRIPSASKPLEKRKAMVIAGCEGLDEISCAGPTDCWMLRETGIEQFQLGPSDFGFPVYPLNMIRGGTPTENAKILMRLLEGKLDRDDPILRVVLMNAAAMLVVSGICEADTSNMGAADDGAVIKGRGPGEGRWKEGVRRAQWAIESGAALQSLRAFTEISNNLASS
ncbi:anthranilate phosphoribosyltransferase [Lecanora helva]